MRPDEVDTFLSGFAIEQHYRHQLAGSQHLSEAAVTSGRQLSQIADGGFTAQPDD